MTVSECTTSANATWTDVVAGIRCSGDDGGVGPDGGQVACLSDAGSGTCFPGACTSSADCAGLECGFSSGTCAGQAGAFCRTSEDLCKTDQDCPDGHECGYFAARHRWACDPAFVTCDNGGI